MLYILHISDNVNFVEFRLLEGQVDIIIKALELYAYNLHFTWSGEDDYELLNSLIYYCYETIQSKYSNNRMGYDINNCKRELERKKNKRYYTIKNYYKKVS